MSINPNLCACVVLVAIVPLTAQFTVTSSSPTNQTLQVSSAAPIRVTFSAPVALATIDSGQMSVFGRWSGVVVGTVSLDGTGTIATFVPDRPYLAGELVTVGLSSAVQSTLGAPLTGGFTLQFWVATRASTGLFALTAIVDFRLPGEGLVRTYGFYAGDIDRDGSPDMSATNEVSYDVRVLHNDGCGGFSGPPIIHGLPIGQEPSPNEGADLNGDGWIDLLTGNQGGASIAVFMNDGSGTYGPPTIYPVGGQCPGITTLDFDGDGDVDVAATNLNQILLFSNDGSGNLTSNGSVDGGGSGEYQVQAADANGDGRSDLFVVNRFSSTVGLLLGNGAGGFTLSATRNTNGGGWGLALGDVNSDGYVDAVVTNQTNNSVAIVRGNGLGGLLAAVTYATDSTPISADLGDLDGDGDLDLTVGNFSSATCQVYRNAGFGSFLAPFSLSTQIATSCSVLVDYDRDGDLDILVTDELDDKCNVFTQGDSIMNGVQDRSCNATLRLGASALRGGFGGRPPTTLSIGAAAFLGLSGPAHAPFLLAVGSAVEPGLLIPGTGLVNLSIDPSLVFLVDGLTSGTPTLDGQGEWRLGLSLGSPSLIGISIAVQAAVLVGGGLVTSNPESGTFVP